MGNVIVSKNKFEIEIYNKAVFQRKMNGMYLLNGNHYWELTIFVRLEEGFFILFYNFLNLFGFILE